MGFLNQAIILTLAASCDANPFAGVSYYVNPEYQAELQGSINTLPAGDSTRATLEAMADTGSAYWIDKKDKIAPNDNNVTDTVEEILADASSYATPPLVVFIVYDAPNRDCAAKASNGEICCTYFDDGTCDFTGGGDCSAGLSEYEDEYIAPFAASLAKYNGKVPVVLVIEPDSLPNLATNLGMPACGDTATQASYRGSVTTAVATLSSACPDSCTLYADAAHGGWLGWPANLKAYLAIINDLGIAPSLRGFTTNSANYQPLGTSCFGASCTGSSYNPLPAWYENVVVPKGAHPAREAVAEAQAAHDHNQAQMVMTAVVTSEKYGGGGDDCCADPCGLGSEGNPANNEMNYAYQLAAAASATIDGFQPYIVIDTGRNGVSDMRSDCADWCNIRNAGIGVMPTTDTNSEGLVDAFFWLKTPGESDGCTEELPNGQACVRYDSACASADSIGSDQDEPRAPEAGQWFDYAIKQLASNAVWEDEPNSTATIATTAGGA